MKRTNKKNIYMFFLLCLTIIIPAQGMSLLYQNIASNSFLQANRSITTKIGTSFVGSLGLYKTYNTLKNHTTYKNPIIAHNNRRKNFQNLTKHNNNFYNTNIKYDDKINNEQSMFSKLLYGTFDLSSLPLIPWYLKQFKAIGRIPSLGLVLAILPYGFYKAITQNKKRQNYILNGKKSDLFYKVITLSSYVSWFSKDIIPSYLAKNTKYGNYYDVKTLFNINKNSHILKTMRGSASAIFCIGFLLEISRLTKKYWPEKMPETNFDDLDMYI